MFQPSAPDRRYNLQIRTKSGPCYCFPGLTAQQLQEFYQARDARSPWRALYEGKILDLDTADVLKSDAYGPFDCLEGLLARFTGEEPPQGRSTAIQRADPHTHLVRWQPPAA